MIENKWIWIAQMKIKSLEKDKRSEFVFPIDIWA